MRVRTGLNPGDWSENEPAVGRFHGPSAWGTRNAAVIGMMQPAVVEHLRTPETASSKAARLKREGKA